MSPPQARPEDLLRLAHSRLESMFGGCADLECEDRQAFGHHEVCVTLRVGGRTRGCYGASAESVEAAVMLAAYRSAMDHRYGGPLRRAELQTVSVELWLLQERTEVPAFQEGVLRGSHGCEVWVRERRAFYLPSVAVERECRSTSVLQQRLFRKGRVFSEASKRRARLFETQWIGIVGNETVRTFTRWGVFDAEFDLTASVACDAAQAIANHLVAIQSGDGSYLYEYNPMAGQREQSNNHPVRQIGCTYALAEYQDAHSFVDEDLCRAIDRGRAFVRRRCSDAGALPTFAGSTYSGTLAFSALALDADRTDDRSLIRSILTAFRDTQSPDGWFPQDLSERDIQGSQDFGAGQILLAFERHCSGDQLLDDPCIERALSFYGRVATEIASPFYLAWQIKAWSRIAMRTNDLRHAQLALKLAKQLQTLQLRASEEVDFTGGYVIHPRQEGATPSFLVSLFTEAMLNIIPLIHQYCRHDVEDVLNCIDQGVAYLLKLQITDKHFYLLDEPELAIGGIRNSLNSFRMRCDYSMHALTCLNLYAKYAYLRT